ncbi:MAG: GGDEF domain-containing protein, partial [Alphaproteobacteria bacterium]|nr:GGDEF domain-containing protein [Alphaproteobacteria bacterium]
QDALTRIANRKCFDERLAREMGIAGRDNTPLTLVMMDIDHFKRFNDTYGHLTGDQVLKLVASTIKSSTRSTDLAARYGGEEFAIIVPACSLEGAVQIAEKVREAVQAKELLKRSTNEKLGRITISGGVAQWRNGESTSEFIERADIALYQAKSNGRNRIEIADATPKTVAA